ncbi:MAG: hypothetical protein OET90_09215, partial [Desulfuromonadales bacterium]|nr:hypothetical protein [Desulfuromonadales bacterium]
RAASAFAIARTFNAIVSVFQGSELQLEPGGVGVSLALGAALDPANDLVERFSWVMLVSLTSLGVQKVLIEITPFVSVQIVLTLALLSMLIGLWLPRKMTGRLMRMGRVLLFVAILLRFAVPAMAYLNNQIYVAFLEQNYDQSIESLGQTVSRLEQHQLDGLILQTGEDAASSQTGEGQSWWDRTLTTMGQAVDQSSKMLDVRTKLAVIKQAALELIDKIVDLIVVFVLSTIVLPLLFFWGLLKLGRLVVGRSFTQSGSPPVMGD